MEWTGNRGSGTSGYRDYDRSHILSAEDKPSIELSSDPTFRGDKSQYNPEELLLAALASCHMLSFLHICVTHGIVVVSYQDDPQGIMEESVGIGQFREATLYPKVGIEGNFDETLLEQLHQKAGEVCFISRSVNFPVLHKPLNFTV
jgi:organic hydroperoxide reductase OsmC/OhrA